MDKTIITKGKIKSIGIDFLYWQSQPLEKRLATIEQLRNEYNSWKYANEQGLQRVYRVVKMKKNKAASNRPQDIADLDNLKPK